MTGALDIATRQLRRDEGERLRPYVDSVGKLTIGVGRNLTDIGISADECALMFEHDLSRATATARQLFNNFDLLSPPRQAVLINMAFNLGPSRLAGFAEFRACVQHADWAGAKAEMLDSKWAAQVGPRARRLAEQIITGTEV